LLPERQGRSRHSSRDGEPRHGSNPFSPTCHCDVLLF
jgi:hypothetical protein